MPTFLARLDRFESFHAMKFDGEIKIRPPRIDDPVFLFLV
jgi:hypothetical protein